MSETDDSAGASGTDDRSGGVDPVRTARQPGVPNIPDEQSGGGPQPGVPGGSGGGPQPGIPGGSNEPARGDRTDDDPRTNAGSGDRNCGAFVCSCADTCSIDVDEAAESIENVDVATGSSMLCDDAKIAELASLADEHDLDDVVVTCPEPGAQEKLGRIGNATDAELHFVDQRERAGWVFDEPAATAATVRLLEARRAGLDTGPHDDRRVQHDVGDSVAVVGDAAFANALSGTADVTLIADGRDLADVDADLDDIGVQRGRVIGIDGRFGEFELTLEARVTEDCISCMDCVHAGPDGMVTSEPVDIDPSAPDGEWVDVCPVDAIDLDGVTTTVDADQIVFPGADAPIGGVRGFHTETNVETVSEIRTLAGGIDEPANLDFSMDVCASGESGQIGCTACSDACPHDAVSRPFVDAVEFDETLCQNCGACTSSCPTGAVQLREPSNERIAREVEQLVRSPPEGGLLSRPEPEIDPQIVAFVCNERARRALERYGRMAVTERDDLEYPPLLPVEVNCADTVGEAQVLHALAAGADGVAIVGCGGSCHHSGPDPKAELVRRLNLATTDLGLGECVEFFAPDPEEPDAFVESISKFATMTLDPSPVPAGEHEATGTGLAPGEALPFTTHAWALESVRTIIDHVEPDREIVRGLESFGTIDVDDTCGLTPTCSNLCPTDALRRVENRLEFNHERCVNCGLCEDGCPEVAITMETGLDVAAIRSDTAWEPAYEGEMYECRGCGREYASKATVEKLKEEAPEGEDLDIEGHIFEYCAECKGDFAFSF